MRFLEQLRSWISRAETASNKLEYTALDGVHRAEEAVDHATGGRFYDTLERADEEADELLDRVGLGEQDEEPKPPGDAREQPPRA
jgi:hypothetical protein